MCCVVLDENCSLCFALTVTSVAAGAIDLWRDIYLEWSGCNVSYL